MSNKMDTGSYNKIKFQQHFYLIIYIYFYMSRLSTLKKEIEQLKESMDIEIKDGFTDEEKKYYREHPIEFANEHIYFKGRNIRLSEDQENFLLFLKKWKPKDHFDNLGNYYDDKKRLPADRALLVASRNGGKTFIFAIYALWRAIFFKSLSIKELGGSLHQSKIFYHEYFKRFIEANPKIEAEVVGKVMATRTEFRSSSVVSMSSCSETSVRGSHPDILLIDEVAAADKAKKTDVVEAALDSCLGQIVLGSTAHHSAGLFIKYIVHSDEFGYEVFRWPVCDIDWETGKILNIRAPWVPRSRIEHALLTKDKQSFEVEWMASTASTAKMVFPLKYIERAIVKSEPQILLAGIEDGEIEDDVTEVPEKIKQYFEENLEDLNTSKLDMRGFYGGCDIGYVHPHAIVIIKRELEDVFWVVHSENYRGRSVNWRAERVARLQELYDIDLFCLDAEDISFISLCIEAGANIKTVPFQNYKSMLIGTLRNLFEKERIKIPDRFEDLINELKIYTYDENDKPMKGNDDNIDALLFSLFFWATETGGEGFDFISFDPWS